MVFRRRKKEQEDGVSLEQVGRWLRQTKHLGKRPGGGGVRGRRLELTSWEQEEVVRAGRRAVVRWRRLGREGRRGRSLRAVLGQEWKRGIRAGEVGGLTEDEIVGALSCLSRSSRRKESRREEEEVEEQKMDYMDYLDSEAVVTVEEEVKAPEALEDGEQEEQENQPDYSSDEAVLEHIREKERHKRGTGGQVSILLYSHEPFALPCTGIPPILRGTLPVT